jgi:transcription antitermination factor NusG
VRKVLFDFDALFIVDSTVKSPESLEKLQMKNPQTSPKSPVAAGEAALSKTPAERLNEQLEHAIEFVVANVALLSMVQTTKVSVALKQERKRADAEAAARRPKVGDEITVTGGRFKGERGQFTAPVARKSYVLVTFAKEGMRQDVVHVDDMEVFKAEG